MDEVKGDKIERVLSIYTKLLNGDIVNKEKEAHIYSVNERSIQRDIDDIRNFLDADAERTGYLNSVVYDRAKKGYRLEYIYKIKLKDSEVLALCKILLDSRAFTKEEMADMLERFIDVVWDIGQTIRECRFVEISYYRIKDKSVVSRKIKPVAIMFSEFYFYLTAFIDEKDEAREYFDVLNDSFPTIYRIDRIQKMKILNERFHIPYSSRFEEGEFRKRVQFMYGGKIQKVKFYYSGPDVDAILDRLPTATILEEDAGGYMLQAEVFGKGIDMWIRSQGENVKVINNNGREINL